ncbi:tyrosine-type recombinase/integrase [Paenibacillus sp. 7516]|uniref:site-specific integrase n=1 Tax=Paenibacillus sp. 7516 TaxID=2022549 RepID=UPI000BA71D34|nr:tyrosine-type recombinase/integrase [Paenibacillus sp. 7516]PAF31901.1 recombinase XerC [Paenibacillus sp. 7516]
MATFRKRNGKWEYRVSYTDRVSGTYKQKSKSGFLTKKEAQLAAAAAEKDINYFGFSEDGEEIVEKYFNEWAVTYKKPNVKPITYDLIERTIQKIILPRWGNYRLKEINRNEYKKWINDLREKYSEGTVRRIHSIVNTAINDAIFEYQIMKLNPVSKIKVPKEVDEVKTVKFFTVEELERFLEEVAKPVKNAKYTKSMQYTALFTLMARTGIRIGEALALTWSDIDLEKGRLQINKTLVYPRNTTPYISTPKSKRSIREIQLDAPTVKVLKRHRINRKEVVLLYENYKQSDTDLVFFQHDGRWLRTNVVREYFKKNCKRANLPDLSPHALRHSHAVHLLEAKADLAYVSKRLGHASIKMTGDTYTHITKKIEDDSLDLYQLYMK